MHIEHKFALLQEGADGISNPTIRSGENVFEAPGKMSSRETRAFSRLFSMDREKKAFGPVSGAEKVKPQSSPPRIECVFFMKGILIKP